MKKDCGKVVSKMFDVLAAISSLMNGPIEQAMEALRASKDEHAQYVALIQHHSKRN